MAKNDNKFDFDQVVVGSGFGGAVSALRLSEKGNRVLVLEKGRRFEASDFAKSNWRLDKFVWMPWVFMRGPFQCFFTRKLTAVTGAGVGGGSLVYANTHLIPDESVFSRFPWSAMRPDWHAQLTPFYALAQRMIGVAENKWSGPADAQLKQVAKALGREDTFTNVNSGLLYPNNEEPGSDRGDPYFNGEGPNRNSCNYCGACMVGCRHNAKNTLDKNYLFFAERNGAEIRAESKVIRIAPIANEKGLYDGTAGYEITVRVGMGVIAKETYTITTRGVVISAGVLGTIPLLLKMRNVDKTLPNISSQLGREVMTNSETLVTVTHNGDEKDLEFGTAITSMIEPDDETKIQVCRYGKGNDASWLTMTNVPISDQRGKMPRFVDMFYQMLKHPLRTLRLINPLGKGRKGIWLLVMQTAHSFVHIETKRPWYYLFLKRTWVATQHEGDNKLRNYFPIAHKVANEYVKRTGGVAGNIAIEVIAGTPLTAHMMGGAKIASTAEKGVVDETGEVFGYSNLRILDGSIIPGNLGVNPSLTILAMSEYAMSKVPVFNSKRAEKIRPIEFSKALNGSVSKYSASGNLHNLAINESRTMREKAEKIS